MSSYHLSSKIIGRSSGRSSVAAAAYRARTEIHDERQGLTFDYKQKADLVHSEIMVSETAPAWMKDRSVLWNHVESIERRKDAQLSREIEIALPAELILEKQIDLVREFVQTNFVNAGMVADINIHHKTNNPHAHIMLTLRDITPDGFGPKNRTWNKKENLLKWRENWASIQNRYLAMDGFDIRVDHRSFAELGIDLEPQKKLGIGKHVSEELKLERIENHREILKENGRRIIEDPTIALNHLTYHHATFTEKEVLKYIHSHSYDAGQFDRCRQAIFNHPELVKVGKDDRGERRFTTRTMEQQEAKMIASTLALEKQNTFPVRKKYIDQAVANRAMTTEQKAAFTHMVAGKNIAVITGRAGSGKSYTLRAVREAFESQGYRIEGAALAGIAAEGLQHSSGIESTTIHKRLWEWQNGRNLLSRQSVLVIDEAAMVGTRQMAEITEHVVQKGAKLILVGDDQQLPAIEAGATFRGIRERVGHVSLTDIKRQTVKWQKDATRLLSGDRKDMARAIDLYQAHGRNQATPHFEDARAMILVDWGRDYQDGKHRLIMAHRNKDVRALNKMARSYLKGRGVIGDKDHSLITEKGKRLFAKGDRVMFLRNEHSIGVKNGSLGSVENIGKGAMSVRLDSGRNVVIDTRFYRDIDYGYAATIHKSQGATIDKTYVLATRGFDRHLAYVSMSRHREEMTLYHSRDREGFKDLNHLQAVFSRVREKDLVVDYEKQDLVDIGQDLKKTELADPVRYYKITMRDLGTGIVYDDEVKFVPGKDLEAQKKAAEKRMSEETKPHSDNLEFKFEEIFKDRRPDFTKEPSADSFQYYKITMRDLGTGIVYDDEVKFVPGKDLATQKKAAEKRMSEETKPHSDNLEFKFKKMSVEEQQKLEQSQDRGPSR